jgi:outer membrane protein assembly factor BamD (BamD/ComL family)|tara:strand:- start:90 stop:398 length:309 start_codon:yes stop_codon:yes gene_type:complete
MKYDRRKAVHQDDRNYALEAKNMVRPLSETQRYNLYKIVIDKLQESQSETRDKELKAVKYAIEHSPYMDQSRLQTMVRGYRSTMAQDARAQDGNRRPWRKQV